MTKTEDQRGHIPSYSRYAFQIVKQKPDYKKVNKTRRQRGYNFEYDIVNAFNSRPNWYSRRMGGSSTGLPDVVSTNSLDGYAVTIEAKSGESDRLYVPRDQIDRCKTLLDTLLSVYTWKYVVFAFKFKANKTFDRKLQYRFLVFTRLDYTDDLKSLCYDIKKDDLFYIGQDSNKSVRYDIIRKTIPDCLIGFYKFDTLDELVNKV